MMAMDKGGFEPPASRMRSGRATVALLAHNYERGGERLKNAPAFRESMHKRGGCEELV